MLQYVYIYMPVGSDGRRKNCTENSLQSAAWIKAFLDSELEGRVVRSVLNGDLTCEYEIMIPEEIMKTENE